MQDSGAILNKEATVRNGNGGAAQSNALQSSTLGPYLDDQAHWVSGIRDDASEGVATHTSASTWTRFLESYSFTCEPDYVLKIRKRLHLAKVGADILWPDGCRDKPELSLIVKPQGRAGEWVHKLTLSGEERGKLELRTPKLRWKIFRVQFQAQASCDNKVQFNYRATTKFGNIGKSQVYKKQFDLPTQRVNFGVRPHVKVNMFFPEVTGSFGSGGQGRNVDQGYCHITVPRVHFRWDLDQRRPGGGGMLLDSEADHEAAAAAAEREQADSLCVDGFVPWRRLIASIRRCA